MRSSIASGKAERVVVLYMRKLNYLRKNLASSCKMITFAADYDASIIEKVFGDGRDAGNCVGNGGG